MTALADIFDVDAGAAYPGRLLISGETALVVFAAGFLGKQDAYWIADAGLRATCVDTDVRKLAAMADMYPGDWEYRVADAYALPLDEKFDVVSLDPWTQDFQKCADHIAAWCAIARRAVIIGTGPNTVVRPPNGWEITETRHRSDYAGGVYWTVLEPA